MSHASSDWMRDKNFADHRRAHCSFPPADCAPPILYSATPPLAGAGDPIKDGLLLVAKRLELLHQLLPKAALFGVLLNPKNPTANLYFDDAAVAARARDLQLVQLNASTEREIDVSFMNLPEVVR